MASENDNESVALVPVVVPEAEALNAEIVDDDDDYVDPHLEEDHWGRPPKNHPTHPRMIKALQREEEIMEYRQMGFSYKRIARMTGLTDMGVAKICKRALARIENKVAENAQEARRLELLRLDELTNSCWDKALDPTHKDHLMAVRVVKELSEFRSRLLGIEAAKKMEVAGEIGVRLYPGVNTDEI